MLQWGKPLKYKLAGDMITKIALVHDFKLKKPDWLRTILKGAESNNKVDLRSFRLLIFTYQVAILDFSRANCSVLLYQK